MKIQNKNNKSKFYKKLCQHLTLECHCLTCLTAHSHEAWRTNTVSIFVVAHPPIQAFGTILITL